MGLGNRPSPGEDVVVDELLRLLTLRDVANRPAVLLPLGTGRLVEVGRALAGSPRVVLLDEPTSGLGSDETERLAATLQSIRAEHNVAFVLVEHDVDLVLSLADTITVLDFGQIIAQGTPEYIRASREVQEAYLGVITESN